MSAASQERFIQEALQAHNEYRRQHGAPDLIHNPILSRTAQSWAQNIATLKNMKHSQNTYKGDKLGENIAMWYSTGAVHYDGAAATKQWYDEIQKYNFAGDYQRGTGHFTQVVWKNTKEVGFGVAKASDGSFYAVANYYPAGNFIGEFRINVLPLGTKVAETPDTGSRFRPIGSDSSLASRGSTDRLANRSNKPEFAASDRSSRPSTNNLVDTERFLDEALKAHNEYRRQHGTPILVHNPELSRIALEWAQNIASTNKMRHSQNVYKGEKLGENVSMFFRTGATHYDGADATKQWYDEVKKYDFNGDYQPGTGHFTQVVWKDTREVGFGVAKAADGSFYAVANYYPAGNFIGEFKNNVFPLQSRPLTTPDTSSRPTRPAWDNENKASVPTNSFPDRISQAKDYIVDRLSKENKSSNVDTERFIQEALKAHNDYRKQHGSPNLVHNPELSKIALKWAQNIAAINIMRHSQNAYKDEKLGENIAMWFFTGATHYDGAAATKQWYDEVQKYNFNGDYQRGTGHFTQVVWKNSKEVGFGVAKAADGSFYAVANYYPAGNFIGEFKNNVLPLGTKVTDSFDTPSKTRDSPYTREIPITTRDSTYSTRDTPTTTREMQNKTRDSPITTRDTPYTREIPINVASKDYLDKSDKSSKPANANYVDTERFVQEALNAHNSYRRKHGSPDLILNRDLSRLALSWAQNVALTNSMRHSENTYKGEKLGENISMWFLTDATHYDGADATKQWYDEIKKYDFRFDYQPGTGHFTQVVWKNTREVGFGVARAADGSFYAVANYYPAGNYIGEFKDNVLPYGSTLFNNQTKDTPVVSSKFPTTYQQDRPAIYNNQTRDSPVVSSKFPTTYQQDRPTSSPAPSDKSNLDKATDKTANKKPINRIGFIIDALGAHNEYRRKHDAPALKHNPEISSIAQEWAEELASKKKLERSGNKYNEKYLGETMLHWYCPGASDYDGKKATATWYNTVQDHDFRKGFNGKSGAFSQLVWRDSKEVGFGIARGDDDHFYIVANYYPAGNYDSQFNENVNRPL